MGRGSRNSAPEYCTPKNHFSICIRADMIEVRCVLKKPPEVITVLPHINPGTEFRKNTVHALHCTNKDMEPQVILNREGTGLAVQSQASGARTPEFKAQHSAGAQATYLTSLGLHFLI